uniref:IP18555p n=1 Tax=Drosophila melanogaster TaxID=7227 RepID=A2VEW8_DROME|nr:uncharacterized protein Dmel_CG34337 [Drosophila melanogaster]ABN49426.1 IP18555p [Drosophila melanogaster]ABW09353.1 uncharacterized protein Dmel_CG34337 [Drosophila melanogaster]AOQ09926.1 CG34337-RA [synthetic construct]|eukprot:NP_001096901.1 uncharacterized protein Dmel_CG34337 [Drosophila melanogaster]
MEYSIFIFLALTCVLFMGQSCLAAPSADDLAKFGEMERSIKELTSSILAMSGATTGFRPGANNVWPEDLHA